MAVYKALYNLLFYRGRKRAITDIAWKAILHALTEVHDTFKSYIKRH